MYKQIYPNEFICCGVKLLRLSEPYIEMVRVWRTKPEIASKMEYRGEITPEMQKKWFTTINNDKNFYFLTYCKENPVGLVNLKNFDADAKEAEGGVFIGEPDKTDIMFGLRSAVAMYHWGFCFLHLETIVIHVLKDNPGAIRMNQMMGFVLQSEQDQKYNQEYRVGKDAFESKTAALQKLFGGEKL